MDYYKFICDKCFHKKSETDTRYGMGLTDTTKLYEGKCDYCHTQQKLFINPFERKPEK